MKGIKLFLTDVDRCLTDGGMYYSEAGEKMNHHSIHTLIVLDDASHVVGIIDSFSCLPGTRFYH